MRIGGLEAGGTKMVAAIGNEKGEIFDRYVIQTKEPEETMELLTTYYQEALIDALGIGCFGPIDLNQVSATYGHILRTPKLRWAGYDIVGHFKEALHIPIGLDTDVNGAILGEVTWGAAKGCKSAIYITIGTGVGVGVYVNGGLLHGMLHPEAGHILLAPHPKDTYSGCCPFHQHCMEGLASGPAIEGRWDKKGAALVDQEEVWELEAFYIAQAVTNYILTYMPQKVILWGGVMHQKQLFSKVRLKVKEMLNGYLEVPEIMEQLETYIVPPLLGEDTGVKGAIQLGVSAINKKK